MPNKTNASSDKLSAGRQRRQANILLLRLQWLLILILIIALVWLYVSQQRFQNKINERLQTNEQVVSRLNEMDDRLFAISPQASPKPSTVVGNQAENQLNLLRIQIQAADRLLADNNYSSSINLLRSLQWQLSQDNNEISPALTLVVKQSLAEDIERLQAQSSQPSPWQLQNIAIQNIQEFLHGYERNNIKNAQANNNIALTRRQLTIHEAIMTLNLAIQASNMRDQEQLNGYLRQARNQLQTLVANASTPQKPLQRPNNSVAMETPTNIKEVMVWLDELIANVPVSKPLVTAQVLEAPKN